LQNKILAFGATSVPCAALPEWAQIRSLSVWAVNIVVFLLGRLIELVKVTGSAETERMR
jgi:hypothetical protein